MGKGWKVAFFSLLVVFLAFIVTLVALFNHYLPPGEKTNFSIENQINPSDPIFTVSTTKEQLQPMINRKISQSNKLNNIHYKLSFEQKDMVLKGTIKWLNNNINFDVKFTPQVLKNGDLMLKEQSIRLGLFNLPVERVMEYIKSSANLPKWVKILPKKKEVYIALTHIHIKNQFYLKARQINLKNDKIEFSVYTLNRVAQIPLKKQPLR